MPPALAVHLTSSANNTRKRQRAPKSPAPCRLDHAKRADLVWRSRFMSRTRHCRKTNLKDWPGKHTRKFAPIPTRHAGMFSWSLKSWAVLNREETGATDAVDRRN